MSDDQDESSSDIDDEQKLNESDDDADDAAMQLSGDDDDEDMDSNDDDDSSSDDGDDKNEEETELRKYVAVLDRINKNKYCYDSYVELVNIAHEISDLDKIRASCELFAAAYPLSPDIWLKWLRIELTIATTDSEYRKVHQLFRRALGDYFSTTVAAEYATLASKTTGKVAETWELIISTYALHCLEGRPLFQAWRQSFIQSEPESAEKYGKLVQMYERELSIPLLDMEETYIELKVLNERERERYAVDWPALDLKYNKAKEELQKMLPFENRLTALDEKDHQTRANIYMEYISMAVDFLSDKIVQVLYERMVTDCCLNPFCWLQYIQYIQSRNANRTSTLDADQQSLVFSQTDWDVCNRALRNCAWSAELYVCKMELAEKMELAKQEVQTIVEDALAAQFQAPEPLVTIWLEYLTYLRRNICMTEEKEVETLRATFRLAWDTLGRQFGVLADCNCEILQLWGRLEYGPLDNLAKGKELWTTVMDSADNASKSGLWIEFAHLEMRKGVDGARKVLRKALATPDLDDLSVISSAWIRFERCHGTLDQLKSCQEQCLARLYQEQVQNTHKKRDKLPKSASAGGGKKRSAANTDRRPDHHLQPKRQKKEEASKAKSVVEHAAKKVPPPATEAVKTEEPLREAPAAIDTANDHLTIFLSNLAYNTNDEDVKEAFPELTIESVNIIKSANGKSRGFGYIQLASADQVEKALTFDRRLINGRPTFVSSVSRDKEQRKKVFKYSESLEPTKLFVKGLSFETTKEELEVLFGEFGAVKDVRMVCRKNGSPKGIAYVEYENSKPVSNAILKTDGMTLKDFKINVSISEPPPKQNKAHGSVNPLLTLGQGRRTPATRGEIKPRMSFIPSSVLKKSTAAASADLNGSTAAPAPKSNEDFRNLFKKN